MNRAEGERGSFPLVVIILRRYGLEFLNLFDEVRLFVVELFVLLSVVVELGKEFDQFVLVAQQDLKNRAGLVGVGYEHLSIKIN